jgi:hypothetical protein
LPLYKLLKDIFDVLKARDLLYPEPLGIGKKKGAKAPDCMNGWLIHTILKTV